MTKRQLRKWLKKNSAPDDAVVVVQRESDYTWSEAYVEYNGDDQDYIMDHKKHRGKVITFS